MNKTTDETETTDNGQLTTDSFYGKGRTEDHAEERHRLWRGLFARDGDCGVSARRLVVGSLVEDGALAVGRRHHRRRGGRVLSVRPHDVAGLLKCAARQAAGGACKIHCSEDGR